MAHNTRITFANAGPYRSTIFAPDRAVLSPSGCQAPSQGVGNCTPRPRPRRRRVRGRAWAPGPDWDWGRGSDPGRVPRGWPGQVTRRRRPPRRRRRAQRVPGPGTAVHLAEDSRIPLRRRQRALRAAQAGQAAPPGLRGLQSAGVPEPGWVSAERVPMTSALGPPVRAPPGWGKGPGQTMETRALAKKDRAPERRALELGTMGRVPATKALPKALQGMAGLAAGSRSPPRPRAQRVRVRGQAGRRRAWASGKCSRRPAA